MTDDDILDEVIAREGGFVDHPADRGGPTKYGITAATLAAWRGQAVTAADVKALTEQEARAIYEARYIREPGFDRIPEPRLRAHLVDIAVHMGPRRAKLLLQRALGVAEDGVIGRQTMAALSGLTAEQLRARLVAHRVRRLARIVAGDPSQVAFLEGWMNRATSFLLEP